MTQFPAGPLRRVAVSPRAAHALCAEFARRGGPKHGLVVDAVPGSPVVDAAVDALLPEDRLTLVADEPDVMRRYVTGLGPWAGDRVEVVRSPQAADPADVVVIGEPVTGTADATRDRLNALAKLLADGGVLTAAAIAVPGVAPGAAAELDRQAALFGVGSDLVLRNVPPLRVHRLRYTPAEASAAEHLIPTDRPSSVPLTRDMNIDSNGVAAAAIALGLAAVAKLTRPRSRMWLVAAAAALPVAAFFRDPQRDLPDDESLVVAASDGKVLSVERVTDDRFSGDGSPTEYLRIAVFLSVLDVHVNRAPVAGKVVDYFVTDGGFAAAMQPQAEHNVSAYTVLDTVRGRVVVAQRTGLLARRIVQRAPVGSLLARGERFGLIRFGSRTDVYLPTTAEPLVTVGDRVLGASTPLASLPTAA